MHTKIQTPTNTPLNPLFKILILALSYLSLGLASLLLAIPPGYAMAIYPPAGLALAAILIGGYRYGFGIVLGSIALNLLITWNTQHTLTITALGLSFTIALGAMFQAFFGAWLIKKITGEEIKLYQQKEILLFMLIGSPIACLINATIGISTLVSLGIMPSSVALINWVTWWAGDSLGVLVFTPICLVLIGQPRQLWRDRRYTVLLPLLITLCIMITGFVFVRSWEQDRIKLNFHNHLNEISTRFQTQLNSHKESQREISAVISSFPNLSIEQFTQISAPFFEKNRDLTALEWIPKVYHSERNHFESQQKANLAKYSENFFIKEFDEHGNTTPAKNREFYFPITLATPIETNSKALGLDVYSKESRRKYYDLAIQNKITVATEPFVLIQEKNGKLSTLLVSAVFKNQANSQELASHKNVPIDTAIGVVVSIFRPGDVLLNLLSKEERAQFQIKLRDINSSENHGNYIDTLSNQTGDFHYKSMIEFGSRKWQLQAYATPSYLTSQQAWAALISLLVGMIFSALVGMYCLIISGRAFQIEGLATQRTKQWQDSERKQQVILDHAADGILTINEQGYIYTYNHAAEIALDLTPSGLQGLSLDNYFTDTSGNPLSFQELISPIQSNSRALLEVQRIKLNGSTIALELAIASITEKSEVLYIMILHDLTERKRIDKVKSEFVSTVSHELRTPLTSICGSLGLLAGGATGELPHHALQLIRLANTNAERLQQLINDILDFEKLEYGGMVFKFEIHTLIPQIQKAIQFNIGYADKFNVQLQFIGESYESLHVRIDEHRFLQILSNLISNAIKFSHANGVVEISLEKNENAIRINVQDYGIGIDEEFSQKIFEKFTQADSSGTRKYSGTGLGLSLAKSMIEKMGGQIGFASRYGHGSKFFLDLPLKK